MIHTGVDLAERRRLPDSVVRGATRWLLARQLATSRRRSPQQRAAADTLLAERLGRGPIAEAAHDANDQHYEVPAEFFRLWLGPRMKYSAGWWPAGVHTLAESEDAMLALTCERAEIEDGMTILDLGCGWGSFALWAAEHYPASRVMAVSNSHSQRAFIESRAEQLGVDNLRVQTADVNVFVPEHTFDRVVSVEMFEHVRNHRILMSRIADWLSPRGKLFVHVFAHRDDAYLYETEGDDAWMGRHFFTGGMMPSHDWLPRFQDHLAHEVSWRMSGRHYARTIEAWLDRLDHTGVRALDALGPAAPGDEWSEHGRKRRHQRWRMFLMACAELFAWDKGDAWGVSHYRFSRR